MMYRHSDDPSAFSLVELSIVLVILGLLVGGVLGGQSLIRASELRAVTAEHQNYVTAAQSFRQKYFMLPGDMNNATQFWNDGNTCGVAGAGYGGVAAVCNGNADGAIQNSNVGGMFGDTFQFWKHLAKAGVLEGSFTGVAGPSSYRHAVPKTNVPASKISGAGWSIEGRGGNPSGDTDRYAVAYGNTFTFGAPTTGELMSGPIIKPEEAWNIDTKVDDGKPASGKIIAAYWNNLCAAADDGSHANNDLVASYKLTDSTNQCALYFRNQF